MGEWRADRDYSKVALTVNCPNCGVKLGIVPASILGEIGKQAGSVEAEIEFATSLSDVADDEGRRLVLADPTFEYTCPECGQTDRLKGV